MILAESNSTAASLLRPDSDPDESFSRWELVVLGILAGCVAFVTVGGNVTVLISFVLERSIRQPPNYFIASLAVSDLLIGTVSMPLYTTYILTRKNWPLGETLCDLWLSIDYTACLCSIYTIFCITVDRFCSIRLPTKYRVWRTERKVLVVVCLTWVIPIAVFFTSIFGWQYFVGERRVVKGKCHVQYMEDAYFNCFLQVGYFWTTLVAMVVLYAGIYRVALDLHRRSAEKRRRQANSLATMAGCTIGHLGTVLGVTRGSDRMSELLREPAMRTDFDNNGFLSHSPVSPVSPVSPEKSLPLKVSPRQPAPASAGVTLKRRQHSTMTSSMTRHINTKRIPEESESVKRSYCSPVVGKRTGVGGRSSGETQTLETHRKEKYLGMKSTSANATEEKKEEKADKEEEEEEEEREDGSMDTTRGKPTEGFAMDGFPAADSSGSAPVRTAVTISVKVGDPDEDGADDIGADDDDDDDRLPPATSPEVARRGTDERRMKSATESLGAEQKCRYSSVNQIGTETRFGFVDPKDCELERSANVDRRTHRSKTTISSRDLSAGIYSVADADESSEEIRRTRRSSTDVDRASVGLFTRLHCGSSDTWPQVRHRTNPASVTPPPPPPMERTAEISFREDPERCAAVHTSVVRQSPIRCNEIRSQIEHRNEVGIQVQSDSDTSIPDHETPQGRPEVSDNRRVYLGPPTSLPPLLQVHPATAQSPRTVRSPELLPLPAGIKRILHAAASAGSRRSPGPEEGCRRQRRRASERHAKRENRAKKALRTITIILGAFVLCWTPWHVLSLIIGFCSSSSGVCVSPVLYDISYWLCYLNSPINPFCYAFVNQQFKNTFLRVLRLKWHRT